MTTNWRVVPISSFQKLDVREDDLLNDGHFRKCNTYRGGGGYDQFPIICESRLGFRLHHQFVVQLYGCNLDCPYCYVTRSGVGGNYISYTSEDLIVAFIKSKQEVFHLMGGAPALYLEGWSDIIKRLPQDAVFHSDFLLTEKPYDVDVVRELARFPNGLYAINIKGTTPENYRENTRKDLKENLFWRNLTILVNEGVEFYLTATNPDMHHYGALIERLKEAFGNDSRFNDDFIIDLIDYEALPFVDILDGGRA